MTGQRLSSGSVSPFAGAGHGLRETGSLPGTGDGVLVSAGCRPIALNLNQHSSPFRPAREAAHG